MTLSLEHLNEVSVSNDSSTVYIGAGNTWFDVYGALEPRNLTVAGGRHYTVGVGGLSLGGGESYFSSLRGWTCDNIKGYRVVLADGSIVTVDKHTHGDLHWALRGGGNNFGIVTSVHMEPMALPGGKVWGGIRLHREEELPQLLEASYGLAVAEIDSATKAGQIITLMVAGGQKMGVSILTHSDALETPDILSSFLSVPAVMDTTRTRLLTNLSRELGSFETGDSKRRARGTVTTALTPDMLTASMRVCFEEFDSVADVKGVGPSCVFQVIRKSQLDATEERGGNALGLSVEDGPLFLLNVNFGWSSVEDTSRVREAVWRVVQRTNDYARDRGWDKTFRYMNYAGEFQDVIRGYGETNKARLKATAQKYDPDRIFQTLQPGYFKLDGSALDEEHYLRGLN